jgi:membrane protein implicated in regulation of membrane protease activity
MKDLAGKKEFIFLIIVCILLIVIYGQILRKIKSKDHLESNVAKCTGCDGWGVLHFLFFALMGFVFPTKGVPLMILGIIWELIETVIGQNDIRIGGKRFTLIGETVEKDGEISFDDTRWWYGRTTDIAFNAVGFVIGQSLNLYYIGSS